MVVLDEEDNRRLVDRGKIESLVNLAGARGAVADYGQAEDFFAGAVRRPKHRPPRDSASCRGD